MRINRSLITFIPDTGAGSGSVTSVGFSATMPVELTALVTGSPITQAGTISLSISITAGYLIPSEGQAAQWDAAFDFVQNFPVGLPGQLLTYDEFGSLQVFTPDYMLNPMVELGDMIFGNAAGFPIRVQPNKTTTQKFLAMTGSGTTGAAPRWETISDATINSLFQIDYDVNIVGDRDSVNTVFQSSAEFFPNTTRLYKNGVRLQRGVGYDYVELSSNQVQFSFAPDSGDLLTLEYIRQDANVSGDYQIDYDVNVTGDRDSINTFFSTTFNYAPATTRVFKNGLRMTRGVSYDYTEYSNNQIQFSQAPDNGDLIIIEYIKS